LIKELAKGGNRLNPATPIHALTDILKELDYILVMSSTRVSGQKFVESTRRKIRQLGFGSAGRTSGFPIEVDGGSDRPIGKA